MDRGYPDLAAAVREMLTNRHISHDERMFMEEKMFGSACRVGARKVLGGAAALALLLLSPAAEAATNYQVLAFNDLGMHCYDKDFSVCSLLPPFNVVHAQVVEKGATPRLLDDSQVEVTYAAVVDETGSINSTSIGKSNFWRFASSLFGVSLAPDQGILGAEMPGAGNTPQPFTQFDPAKGWFTAAGIPITATDDAGRTNHYPIMRISAVDKVSGATLASTDIVLPVSPEMHCSECHVKGGVAANWQTARRYDISGWSKKQTVEKAFRENILILHDAKHQTNLVNCQPVLCASCHYSPALDLAGTGPNAEQATHSLLSFAVHGRHGRTLGGEMPTSSKPAIIPDDGTTSCYSCHPGATTQCLRGAMGKAGISCQDCHGGILAVAGAYGYARVPWCDEPKCQSCHTGDALNHLGPEIRGYQTYKPGSLGAKPIIATNKRFAEENNTLFRNSRGHGGLACEACHGSTHAIWPSAEANDNVAPVQLQGHSGPIIECQSCHGSQLGLTTQGPHGMHNVNDPRWINNHESFFESNPNRCRACHGQDLLGTVLSRAATDRSFLVEGRRVAITAGESIGCNRCHSLP